MLDVVSQKLPPFRVPELGVHLRKLAIDDVQAFDRRQRVPQSRETQMCAAGTTQDGSSSVPAAMKTH